MEKNIPSDDLEDFLRKSLAQYSDEPSSELWGKIEGSLGAPAPAPIVRRMAGWKAWAAAAAVAGLLVGEYFFHQKQMDELRTQMETHSESLRKLEQRLESASMMDAHLPKANNPTNESPAGRAEGLTNEKVAQRPDVSATSLRDARLPATANSDQPSSQPTAALDERLADVFTEEKNISDEKATAPAPVAMLGMSAVYPQSQAARPGLAALPVQGIQPVQQRGKWSVGVQQYIDLSTSGTITSLRQRPGRGVGHHQFDDAFSVSGSKRMTGLTVRQEQGGNWYLQTGLAHHQLEFTSTHRPSFEFGDRKGGGGPGGPGNEHDFSYSINTAVGEVEVEVRAEQTDPTEPIDDRERLQMEIKTKHSLQYISVPLLVGRKLGNGRLYLDLQGGILANFLLENKFQVTGFDIVDNAKFRGSRTRRPSAMRSNLRQSNLDYLLSAGIGFNLTKAASLSVSPTVTGSLTSRHNDPYIDSSDFSVGLSAGISYRF